MKDLKFILVLVGVAVLSVASVAVYCFRGEAPRDKKETLRVSRTVRDGAKEQSRQKPDKRQSRKPKAIPSATQVGRSHPTFQIEKKDDDALSAAQRALLEEIRAALREDDYKSLMKLVRKMQSSDEWPDGIPNSIKKAALEALGWYGSKCLPEIVPFLADSNPEIVADAVSQWEDAIAECDSDREVSEQVKLASRVVVDADSVDSILVEAMNMRHSVAVDTFKDVLANGNEQAKAKVLEQIADYTDDPTITTAEQLDVWLEKNPDDPGDEEMYGGIDENADDD